MRNGQLSPCGTVVVVSIVIGMTTVSFDKEALTPPFSETVFVVSLGKYGFEKRLQLQTPIAIAIAIAAVSANTTAIINRSPTTITTSIPLLLLLLCHCIFFLQFDFNRFGYKEW